MRLILFIILLFSASICRASSANDIGNIRDFIVDGESRSALGDPVANEPYPTVSLNSIYNLLPANGRTYTASGGSVTVSGREFVCSTGTTIYAYGTLQTFRAISHRAGFGVTVRMGARFPDAVASTWQAVGAFTIGDEASFGRNGTDFGVWHRYGGKPEVQTLTVSGAAGGSENATVTIDGVEFTVALTASTTATNAAEIAAHIAANSSLWDAYQVGSTVVISSKSDGNKTGDFLFSSDTATASWAETKAGVTKTSNFIKQASWNGRTPGNFNPIYGNNYQIRYANGFGAIKYYIQDQETGNYVLCHTVRWGSANATENFGNPSLHLGAYAVSTGGTTNTTVYCSYLTAFIDGSFEKTRNPRAYSNTKSISTTATNIFTLRNARVYNGETNQSEIEPLYVTLSNDGAKSAVFELRTNATLGGTTNYTAAGNNLISQVDVAGTTISGGTLIASFTVAKGQSVIINLGDTSLSIPPTLTLTISGVMTSGAAADLTAALTWYEDI